MHQTLHSRYNALPLSLLVPLPGTLLDCSHFLARRIIFHCWLEASQASSSKRVAMHARPSSALLASGHYPIHTRFQKDALESIRESNGTSSVSVHWLAPLLMGNPSAPPASSGCVNACRTRSFPLPCCETSVSGQTYTSRRSAFEMRTLTTGITSCHATKLSRNSDRIQEKNGRRRVCPCKRRRGVTHSSLGGVPFSMLIHQASELACPQ